MFPNRKSSCLQVYKQGCVIFISSLQVDLSFSKTLHINGRSISIIHVVQAGVHGNDTLFTRWAFILEDITYKGQKHLSYTFGVSRGCVRMISSLQDGILFSKIIHKKVEAYHEISITHADAQRFTHVRNSFLHAHTQKKQTFLCVS